MPRSRNIKPAFFKNESLAECVFEFRLLFVGLWTLADRKGRLEDRPKRIKAEIFPFDQVDVTLGLATLSKLGFITQYKVGGSNYIQILNFEKHQSPHIKEQASTIPAPDSQGASPSDSLLLIPDSGLLKADAGKRKAPAPDKSGVSLLGPEGGTEGIVKSWNAMAQRIGIPPVKALNDKRRKGIELRFQQPGFNYSEILAAIERSPFLRGKNERGWKVDFDFVFGSSGNFLKILEGKYDGKGNGEGSGKGGREVFDNNTIERLTQRTP